MAYLTPTLDQFKEQFPVDFPYAVPSFGATGKVTVSGGGVTAIAPTAGGYFYKATPLCSFSGGGGTGAAATATVTGNQVTSYTITAAGSGYVTAPVLTVISQDGDDTDTAKVIDLEITNAQRMASFNFNAGLFGDQASYSQLFNLLTAHFLVTSVKASNQGLASQYDWLTQQRTVGSVNASFAIPKWVKDSPFLSTLSQTQYGAQYLGLITPLIRGHVAVVCGATTP